MNHVGIQTTNQLITALIYLPLKEFILQHIGYKSIYMRNEN